MKWPSELWWDYNTMITDLSTYILYISICGILYKYIELSKKITLFDSTHLMSMTDPEAIGVETPRIDSM